MAGTLPNRTIDISAIVPGLDGKVRPHDPSGLLGGGTSFLVDSFEYADNQIPIQSIYGGTYRLWRPDSGVPAFTIEVREAVDALFGNKYLRMTSPADAGSNHSHVWFETRSYNALAIQYMRSQMIPQWVGQKQINRMRLWVRVNPGFYAPSTPGNHNFHVASYTRRLSAATNSQESDNGHWYHHYALTHEGDGTDGAWWQIIADTKPSNQRGPALMLPSTPLDDMPNEPGYNYFDLLTRWYLVHTRQSQLQQTIIDVDGVELYSDPNDEDVLNISSMHACRSVNPATPNKLVVNWCRQRSAPSALFDIRYATTSFHQNGGFSHGAAAPSGTGVASLGGGDYEMCQYTTEAIDLTGLDFIYIAIQRQGVSGFREIRIPLTSAGYPIIGGSN